VIAYWFILLVHTAVRYHDKFQERAEAALRLELNAAELRAQLTSAQLGALKMQLQPHFLFNTLHAISALVWTDPARADRLLARLSEMLRLTLRSGTRVETTLAEELTLLERYAEIQEARYGDRLRVSFDVEAGVREALVPRLILQPLVENAIRHGVTRRITPGQVEVRAWRGDGRLNLTVRDDGVGLGHGVREGVGLSITRARLRQLYGREQRFALAPAPDGGAVCSLSIPFRMAEAAG
jgi:LytS/YehU family sensor histidine kinase